MSRTDSTTAPVDTVAPPGTTGIIGDAQPVPSTRVDARPLVDGSIDDAIAVAEGLRATDLGCEIASVEVAMEQVSCLIGDDLVSISRFADHAALVASAPTIRGGACFLAANKENVNLTYVEGDNWIVYPQEQATAHAIARALEAGLRVIDCPTP